MMLEIRRSQKLGKPEKEETKDLSTEESKISSMLNKISKKKLWRLKPKWKRPSLITVLLLTGKPFRIKLKMT